MLASQAALQQVEHGIAMTGIFANVAAQEIDDDGAAWGARCRLKAARVVTENVVWLGHGRLADG
jgi:hypothetical protein